MKKIRLEPYWALPDETQEEQEEDIISNIIDSSFYFTINDKEVIAFETDTLRHTCGIIEFGQLEKIHKSLTKDQFNNLMGFIVTNLKYTFIINTLNKGNSSSWNKYLKDCPYFNKIKTFKNPNSGNNINVWISI